MSGLLAERAPSKHADPADPVDGNDEEGGGRKLVITLGSEAAAATRRMAEELKVPPPEAVRRGLMLLDMLLSLDAGEELVIRNRKGEIERLRFHWGYR
jgi:hypothetical protein